MSVEMIGHDRQREQLRKDLESGNVAHAYLFAGPPHLGKTTLALWFAQELLLEGIDDPTVRDAARRQIDRLIHPDLLVLDQLWIEDVCEDWSVIARSSNIPQVHRSKHPAARSDSISIGDVRVLQDRLQETGFSRYRCCVIRSIERMQDPAANALLKILEEPPPGLVFLLTTESLEQLLPTIVSRTRVIRCAPLRPAEVRALLDGVPEEDVNFILSVARGAPGTASVLRDDPDVLRAHRLLHGAAHAFWQSTSLHGRLQALKPLEERGQHADDFLLHLALTLREQEDRPAERLRAFTELLRGLETNAHRGIVTQRFALEGAGTDSREKGAGSREKGAGSREQIAGSREKGARRR